MEIYFSPFSPYVRRCLVVAHELGLNDRIKLRSSNAHPINRDQAIIAHNPLGKVPALFTDDGLVLFDSRVICEYLNDLANGKLMPQQGAEKWQTLTLNALGEGMLDAALLARYEEVARPESLRFADWKTGQMDKIETSLSHLNRHNHGLRQQPDMAMLTIGCVLWYLDLRFATLGWRERHPNVAAWYAAFSQRPSMLMDWSLPG